MFLPSTIGEIKKLGWDAPDVILVSGDAYLDTPFSGTALVGRVLTAAGFRTAVIAQPDVASRDDIRRLGEPRLFWGVTGGCVDSMVANFTATGKRRRQDDFTPGGENNARPDRAVIAYCNLIRSAFKPCKPIVIGGIEASLRRIAHYDYWSDSVRRPILFDAKADILAYGMAERTVVEIAKRLQRNQAWHDLPGICYAAPKQTLDIPNAVTLPPFAAVATKTDDGRAAFLDMFRLFSANQDPHTARPLVQEVDTRCLVHTPPTPPLSTAELDAVYALPFTLDTHPVHAPKGRVRAWDTIRFSITTHRGCYGECNFCAISAHQGRRVTSRSERSILDEAARLTRHPKFSGVIADVGGPTANMYGFECARKRDHGACPGKRCLWPSPCPSLKPDHTAQIALLRKLRELPGVRHVFVASGIRPDLVAADAPCGARYIEELARYHVSGQIKLAPEHSSPPVLRMMGKPGTDSLLAFKEQFEGASKRAGKRQFLTYYLIAAHPGCTDADMRELKRFATQRLRLTPEQVQVFTPTPSTWSTAMYHTGTDPSTGRAIHVARGLREKQGQKDIILS
ncbi:MAG: YgiQ family radical SAM protein [Kiritimatiellaeota bacterium]|nr:YgiQ family radical SAM protein [Kiritimatiellota bacterium]